MRSTGRCATTSWACSAALFIEQALTVVAVTHDQAEAFALADRIVVVDDGRVLQAGPPAEVWGRPVGRRVATLLGLTNVIEGTVRRGVAATAWGRLPVPGTADGEIDLLVRPTGVVVDGRGRLEAEVRDATFEGPRTSLELCIAGAPVLRAEVPSSRAPARGERLRVRITPDAVVALGPRGGPVAGDA